MKFKKDDIIEIVWLDSFNSSSGWKNSDEIEKWINDRPFFTCKSIGYMIKETTDYVILGQTKDENSYGDVMGLTSITKGTIKSIRRLK